jgi:hypothetical protein
VVEAVRKGVQKGGLARLAGRVNEEVLLGFNKPLNIAIYIPEGIDHVVFCRITESGGIEKPFHRDKDKEYWAENGGESY